MGLRAFGEEVYETLIDINDGQSTKTFQQGDDAEIDVAVTSTSVPVPQTISGSFSPTGLKLANDNVKKIVFEFTFSNNIYNINISASASVKQNSNSSNDPDPYLEINGTQVDSVGPATDDNWYSMSGSVGPIDDNKIIVKVYCNSSTNPARIDSLSYDADIDISHSTSVDSVTKS